MPDSPLVNHWRQLDVENGEYIHPMDEDYISDISDLVTDLPPYPFIGDIENADVLILMLNSGFANTDYKELREYAYKDYYMDRLQKNLRQQFDNEIYPFLALDPQLSETGTYKYYYSMTRLEGIIRAVAGSRIVSISDAIKEVSRRVAVVQLFPYRSNEFKTNPDLLKVLPSCELARRFVHANLNSKLIVAPRSVKAWGFDYGMYEDGRIVTYESNQARTASLKPKAFGGVCKGGDAIIQHLLD